MANDPVAVDLFCGGGGFSEGLRQAGFDITHAVDNDSGAVETYRLNHPEAEVIQKDILELEPDALPDDVDVVFGSPPCTEFSFANSGGNGDIAEGMKLVARFMYFVVELDPDYWVMENVPRLDNYLEDEYTYEQLGIEERDGVLEIPNRAVLTASDYGAPQRRDRLFSGDFPLPEEASEEALSFGEVQESFPAPTSSPEGVVRDPLYDIEIPAAELSDHYYISHLTEREAKEIKVRKADHSFYGRMQFPDDPSVPSRTVLATNRRVARETLVMEEDESVAPERFSKYRKPTIREIGTIQGFPITYQFTGTSVARKWNRVGDAVPVPLAYRIGQSIREALAADGVIEAASVPRRVESTVPEGNIGRNLNAKDFSNKGRRRLSLSRSFRHHVPYDTKTAFRVDLDTDKETHPEHPAAGLAETPNGSEDNEEEPVVGHPVAFDVVLYKGYSSDVQSLTLDREQVATLVAAFLDAKPEMASAFEAYVADLQSEVAPLVPDATTLQAIRSRRARIDRPLEYEVLEAIAGHRDDDNSHGVVDAHFPYEDYEDVTIDVDILGGTTLPVRVLMKAVGAMYVAGRLNHCQHGFEAYADDVFIPDELADATRETIVSEATCRLPDADHACIDEWLLDLQPVSTNTQPAATQ
ncbi:DNA cytosine methyltransferase [Halorubellus salinus]|uniref:DNA cytosine methyltransferase n=1 Tax=Halorubellus salinus TaxID=755309 RepID=UPI001D075A60|nr:DNA cytosine methyltransferase [Halorubellus salinus]